MPLIEAAKLTDASGNPHQRRRLGDRVPAGAPADRDLLRLDRRDRPGRHAHAGRRPAVRKPRLQDPVRLGRSIRLAPRRPPGERGRVSEGRSQVHPGMCTGGHSSERTKSYAKGQRGGWRIPPVAETLSLGKPRVFVSPIRCDNSRCTVSSEPWAATAALTPIGVSVARPAGWPARRPCSPAE